MLQRLIVKPILLLLVGGTCISASAGKQASPSANPSTQGIKPGVSDDSTSRPTSVGSETGREEFVNNTPAPRTPKDGSYRMADWNNKASWRYDRAAYYQGKSQAHAYRDRHPYGSGGIGYDSDIHYDRKLQHLQELYRKNPTAANKEKLEHFVNPYSAERYQGTYGVGSSRARQQETAYNEDEYQGNNGR